MTLTPASSGAKVFYVTRRTRCIAENPDDGELVQRKNIPYFARGSNMVPKSKRTVFDSLAKGRGENSVLDSIG